MPGPERLRPVERCVLRLAAGGADDVEIAHRFKRSPAWVALVRRLAEIDRHVPAEERGSAADDRAHVLRPLERRILRWRAHGAGHEELGARFRRSPGFLERVETYANYKLAAQ
jgi:DNA-binding CsgD family transcriptional regulator